MCIEMQHKYCVFTLKFEHFISFDYLAVWWIGIWFKIQVLLMVLQTIVCKSIGYGSSRFKWNEFVTSINTRCCRHNKYLRLREIANCFFPVRCQSFLKFQHYEYVNTKTLYMFLLWFSQCMQRRCCTTEWIYVVHTFSWNNNKMKKNSQSNVNGRDAKIFTTRHVQAFEMYTITVNEMANITCILLIVSTQVDYERFFFGGLSGQFMYSRYSVSYIYSPYLLIIHVHSIRSWT